MFSQEYFTCEWWFNVDCAASAGLYSLNEDRLASSSTALQPQNTRAPANYGAPAPQANYGSPAPASYAGGRPSSPPRFVTSIRSAQQTPNFTNPEYFLCLLFEYCFQIKVFN